MKSLREEVVRNLTERHDAKVVLVRDVVRANDHDLVALRHLGIHGIVASDEVGTHLIPAVHAVVSGLVCSSGNAFPNPLSAESSPCESIGEHLTLTERSVLVLLQERFTNKEIAERLGVRETTVKFHVANILSKLGIHSRYDLPHPWHESSEGP